MPLRSLRRSSGSSQSQRKKCRYCNNLDPRGHPSSVYPESSKDAKATLTLVLDAFYLSRIKSPTDGGCRFCDVLVQALDAFIEDWRGGRQRVTIDLKEKASIHIAIDGEKWKDEKVEIYATSGRSCFHLRLSFPLFFILSKPSSAVLLTLASTDGLL